MAFEIEAVIICWLRNGMEGADQIYINTDEKRSHTPFEITEFRAVKAFPDVEVVSTHDRFMVDAIDEEIAGEANIEPKRSIDDLHQRLYSVEKLTASTNVATWVTTLAVAGMAVAFIF